MSVLISGSLAYDHIMSFQDSFKNHILADKMHMLNVSFLVPEMRKEYGGCAGNIAYANKLLGGNPIPMGTAGSDFDDYMLYLSQLGIDISRIKQFDDCFTAQAFITTDIDDNQLAAFHPGAMARSAENEIGDTAGVSLAIVSPDSKEGMQKVAQELFEKEIPFLFDLGQAMPLFNGIEILDMINKASYVIANDYEAQIIQERTGLSAEEISEKVTAYIVTLGSKGTNIYRESEIEHINAANITKAVDPVGCGDAYRGGLLYGLEKGFDLKTSVQIGSILGALKIEVYGPQNYDITKQQFEQLYQHNYKEMINL